MAIARQLHPAERRYRGGLTEPERWDNFHPRQGDVLLATPAKSGTTWTQSMIAMLLYGTTDLPDKLGIISPWVDANLTPLADCEAALAAQTGRRVIKTHTPADGWAVWADIHVVSVFRHPMEVFLSLRKHLANALIVGDDHPLLQPLDDALECFLTASSDETDIDRDSVDVIVTHFRKMVLSDRVPNKLVLNYATISRDHAGTVAKLDAFLGTGATPELQRAITEATGFDAMKKRARDFAPEASNDIWREDAAFFAGGRSGAWAEQFTDAQIAAYDARFAELLPEPAHRRWIETGHGDV